MPRSLFPLRWHDETAIQGLWKANPACWSTLAIKWSNLVGPLSSPPSSWKRFPKFELWGSVRSVHQIASKIPKGYWGIIVQVEKMAPLAKSLKVSKIAKPRESVFAFKNFCSWQHLTNRWETKSSRLDKNDKWLKNLLWKPLRLYFYNTYELCSFIIKEHVLDYICPELPRPEKQNWWLNYVGQTLLT